MEGKQGLDLTHFYRNLFLSFFSLLFSICSIFLVLSPANIKSSLFPLYLFFLFFLSFRFLLYIFHSISYKSTKMLSLFGSLFFCFWFSFFSPFFRKTFSFWNFVYFFSKNLLLPLKTKQLLSMYVFDTIILFLSFKNTNRDISVHLLFFH
jgi:hypothetical protein